MQAMSSWLSLLLLTFVVASVNSFLLPVNPVSSSSSHTRRISIHGSRQRNGGKLYMSESNNIDLALQEKVDVTLDPPMSSNADRFIVDIGVPEPTAEELAETNLVKIVKLACKDEEVNMLAWKCLGYRYIPTEGRWDNTNVYPKWRTKYPDPPDLVGVTRIYEKDVDAPVKRANTALVRSVPKMYKQSLKELLAPYGFKGFKIAELTPNRTRRAQVCNWILYYKRDLWGIPLEELLKKKDEVTQVTREGETPEQLAKKMVY